MEEIRFKESNSIRLDKFLSNVREDFTRNRIQSLIKNQDVFVNDKSQKSSYKLKLGDIISIDVPDLVELEVEAENIPIKVLYEDEDILVVDKPKGMVVHPAPGHESGTLVNAILFHCKDELSGINGVKRPGIVHRIDKDTTGSLIICKNNFSHEIIADQIANHSLNRIYVGIVNGVVKDDKGTINAPIGRDPRNRKRMGVVPNGRVAITHFRVLERFKETTFVEFKLETGRTHQIRVHMASIGHPLLGDEVYGPKKCKFKLEGQTLHAKTLGFVHPRSNDYIEVNADIPEYFSELLRKL